MPGSEEQPRKFRFGPYELDEAARELRKYGQSIHLQDQPWEVLRALVERPGEVVSREDLRRRLWPDGTYVEYEQSLNKAVNKLREALCDSADRPRYVETLARRGYRFVAPVELERPKPPEPDRPNAEREAPKAELERPVEAPATQTKPAPSRARLWWSAGTLGLLIAAILVTGLWPVPVPRVEKVVRLTNDSTKKISPTWTTPLLADGTRVLFGDGYLVWSVAASGGDPHPLHFPFLADSQYEVKLCGYSPALQQFLIEAGPGLRGMRELWIMGPEGESPRRVAEVPGPLESALAPDGTRLLLSLADGIHLQSLANGEKKRILTAASAAPRICYWHPDGRRIGFLENSANPAQIRNWRSDAAGAKPARIVPEEERVEGAGVWSPDGARFYYVAENEVFVRMRAGLRGWLRGASASRLTAGGRFSGIPAVDPLHPRFLYAVGTEQRGEVTRYDRKKGTWVPFIHGLSGDCLNFSPDGE